MGLAAASSLAGQPDDVQLRADLEITDPGSDVTYVVAFDPRRDKYFRLSKPLYQQVTANGHASPGAADRLDELGLLDGSELAPASTSTRRFSLSFWQLAEFDPAPLLDRLAPVVRVVAGWPGVITGLLAMAAGVAALATHAHHYAMTPAMWPFLALGVSVAIILHELGHAFALTRFGGRVRRVGIALMYLRPICFCDVSAAWTLRRRAHRVVVASAGIFVNLTLAGASWSLLWIPHLAPALRHFAAVFGVANVVLAVVNLFPFIKLDGYWMLASAVDEPNLRAHTVGEVKALAGRITRRRVMPRPTSAARVGFGLLSLVAPALLVAGVVLQMWSVASRFGPAGRAAYFLTVAAFVWQLIPTALARVGRALR